MFSAISISPVTATINVGGTQQLTSTVSPTNASNCNLIMTSSNTAVATVGASALVTAIGPGSATIIAAHRMAV